jgi:hypothetical protein
VAGRPRHAGPARGLAGDLGGLGTSGKKERKGERGADRWCRLVREKEGERARAGWRRGAGLSAEEEVGRAEQAACGRGKENGPRGKGSRPEREKRNRPGWAAWAVFLFPGFLILFYFFSWFSTSNLFEFKSKFEFNSYALKQIKLMHQHECTNMLKLK